MNLFYAGEMRRLDKHISDTIGLSEAILMENAGRSVADAADIFLGGVCGKKIIVFAGKGNNGGDGLVAARLLSNMGALVKVVTMTPVKEINGNAGRELKVLKFSRVPIIPFGNGQNNFDKIMGIVQGADLFIDAILGTGFQGQLQGVYEQAVRLIAHCAVPVIAVDIPSGVEADTGRVAELAVHAQLTVTMLGPKLGLYLYPGASYSGDIVVADLGAPIPALQDYATGKHLLTEDIVAELLPLRPANAHKGVNGKAKLVAGSLGYTGAAALASEAAVRTGSGLVTLLTPQEAQGILAVKLTEVMTKGFTDLETISEELATADAVAVGPGLGQAALSYPQLKSLLLGLQVPVVLDADALNCLQGHTELLSQLSVPSVLTPHPGEFARLLGCSIAEVLAEPIKLAREAAQKWQTVVVLKTTPTIIACPDSEIYVNTTGNAGMATGGCGDVLTGVVVSLLGQGLEAAEAAMTAVFLHGMAGDLAAAKGSIGLKAGDLLKKIPRAWHQIINSGTE